MRLSTDYLESVEFDLFEHAEGLPFLKDFTLGSLIYHGAQSQIYRLCDEKGDSPYLLKAISKQTQNRLQLKDLMALDHPRLQRIIKVYETTKYYYVIKAYLPGRTLGEMVSMKGPMSGNAVEGLILQLIDGVRYLHAPARNIVYRDIKPENIIISDTDELYLIDLESMRRVKVDQHADTVAIITKGYAAPEQYGYSQTDKRSDIYSIGATLYFMLTGKHMLDVWYSTSGASGFDFKQTSLSPKWRYIISKCVKFNPAERYQDLEHLAIDIKCHEGHRKFKEAKGHLRPKQVLIALIASTVLFLGWQNMVGPEHPEGATEEQLAALTTEPITEPVADGETTEVEASMAETTAEDLELTDESVAANATEPAQATESKQPQATTTSPVTSTSPVTTAPVTISTTEATSESAVSSSDGVVVETTSGPIDIVNPSDPDSMFFKLTLKGAEVSGTVSQLMQVFDNYGHANQCGANTDYVDGAATTTMRQPAKVVPFIDGRSYIFVTYIDANQNFTLDIGERFSKISGYIYRGGNTLSLTFDTFELYKGGMYNY